MIAAEVVRLLRNVRKSGSGWTARCPGHRDRHNSLSIGTGRDGRVLLHCFAGCEFKEIVAALGLGPQDFHVGRSNEQRTASAGQQADAKLEKDLKILRFRTQKKMRQQEKLKRQTSKRLIALRNGANPTFEGEVEFLWKILADTDSSIRRSVAAYYILSFGPKADLDAFVLHPERREPMIDKVLDVCYVRDDQGRYMAVTL